jgi:hypothetical protein
MTAHTMAMGAPRPDTAATSMPTPAAAHCSAASTANWSAHVPAGAEKAT